MATQTLQCRPGNHVWRRESQRGKPPSACPEHSVKRASKATVIQAESSESEKTAAEIWAEHSGPAINGVALCDRLMNSLASRGQLLSQQKSTTYSGPRW